MRYIADGKLEAYTTAQYDSPVRQPSTTAQYDSPVRQPSTTAQYAEPFYSWISFLISASSSLAFFSPEPTLMDRILPCLSSKTT